MKKVAFLGEIAVSSLAMAIVSIAYAPPARAQDQAATGAAGQGDAGEGAGEIIVTGSRLGRTSFNSPTPVNVIGQQRAEDLNITKVADALNQIPAFRPIAGPTPNQPRSSAYIAGRSLAPRGMGTERRSAAPTVGNGGVSSCDF